jgi:hypothetical protein
MIVGWRGFDPHNALMSGGPGQAGAFFFFGLSAEIFDAIILLSRSALAVGLIRVTGRQDLE